MRSAYAVLGVPGNATPEEIQEAFDRAAGFYTPEKIAAGDGVVDKFNELKTAFEVLRDPQSRAAHDRKLTGQLSVRPSPRVEIIPEEESPGRRLLWWGILMVGAIFAAGFLVQSRNAEARKEQAALEIVARKQADAEAAKKRDEDARLEAERVAARARAEADDRRFSTEGQYAAQRASNDRARSEANALQAQRQAAMEAQRQEAAAAMQDQRNAQEARMRVEADKRRIRELCIQLYRRVDC